ncbi:MAG: TonB-dependent receptor family protein, partial [Myxococcaceae bacterium]
AKPAGADAGTSTNEILLETVVVGTPETATSGSLLLIKEQKLTRFEHDDPVQVLISAPGVYARGEDGFGLRPNVGLRGANSDRSKKVTLLEDGVLFGPAPYSAPAAYYFPLITRMQSVRVLKGPSAVVHGPNTVGGSVELITRGFKGVEELGIDVAGGQYWYGKGHVYYGNTLGKTSFVLEGVHLRSNGFKQLDGGGDTGFAKNEWMLKVRRILTDNQKLELKLGYATESANETYLGLSDADFRANPLRRYAASGLDHMQWHRTEAVLRHELRAGPWVITSSAYRNDFDRTWRKVNRLGGAAVADVLADPTSSRNAVLASVLRGEEDSTGTDDQIWIGPNHRVFVSQGIQSVARAPLRAGPVTNNLELGARYHFDSIDRVHVEDAFRMESGHLVFADRPTLTTVSNRDSTHAVALHALDALNVGRLTLTPGARVEIIRSKTNDRLEFTQSYGSVVAVLPGLGANLQLARPFGIFAGVHRGFTPPAPGSGNALPESSVNFEGGARWSRPGERLEAIGFFNNYSNLTDLCTESNGCVTKATLDQQFSVGSARIYGVEVYGEKNLRLGSFNAPLSLAYTWTRTRLLESFTSPDPQFGRVRAGDELPYVPQHQLVANAGIGHERFSLDVAAIYMGAMREVAGQGVAPAGLLTDAQLTFDATAAVMPFRHAKIYLNVRNLLDSRTLSARRPFGARPIAPRTVKLCLNYELYGKAALNHEVRSAWPTR